MNTVSIMGTITKDVEIKHIPSGATIGKFNIAVNQDYKSKDGQKIEKVSFFEVTTFGKQAETVSQYFKKGSRILINGELEQQSWEKDGQKQSKVIIKMEKFFFVDRKSDAGQNKPAEYQAQKPVSPVVEIDEDEIPF